MSPEETFPRGIIRTDLCRKASVFVKSVNPVTGHSELSQKKKSITHHVHQIPGVGNTVSPDFD
jgi:hypothetical protein